jgi:hypothetical protein
MRWFVMAEMRCDEQQGRDRMEWNCMGHDTRGWDGCGVSHGTGGRRQGWVEWLSTGQDYGIGRRQKGWDYMMEGTGWRGGDRMGLEQ